jgi:regulation of enolase protein 1 (concanavalin A-like superfamily)
MHKRYLWALAGALAFTVGGLKPALAGPPAGFTDLDVGTPSPAGSSDVDSNGVVTIKGGGDDIWNNADNFHYLYQKQTGDVTITAQYLSMTPGDASWTKTGPMIRTADTDTSSHAELVVTSANNTVMQGRLVDGDASSNPYSYPLSMSQKGFLRLQRSGNDISSYVSTDGGKSWNAVGTMTLTELKDEALVGLAITSHQDGTEASGQFDNLSVAPGASLVYGITHCGGDKAVMLSWKPLKGATSYNLYRAAAGETDPTKFVKVNDKDVTGTTFTDTATDLVNNQNYTYLIAPVTTAGEGGRAAVSAGPIVLSPPQGYTVTSINEDPDNLIGLKDCGALTGASIDPATGVITIHGSGNDIWNNADQFNFTSQEVEGDFQVTVKALDRPTATDPWSKAGLMIREGLDAGARDAYFVLSNANGLTFQWRDTTDGGAAWSNTATLSNDDLKPPIWIRMTRKGDQITGEYSLDEGKTWLGADADENKITLDGLSSKVNVGLAITAHSPGKVSEAHFSDLSITKL